MVHLYRAEVQRSSVWRNRLDVTTNWAVISTGAAISFAFAQPTTHHGVVMLMTGLVTLFLFIEARRYRYYEMWSYRVRLLETDLFAAMLRPPFQPRPDWAENLAKSLRNPQFPISTTEALGRRLRRNYIWIYLILGLAWIGKLLLFPEGLTSLNELFERARLGALQGWIVLLLQGGFYLSIILLALRTARTQSGEDEVLHRKAREVADLASEIAVDGEGE
jgi:uncharacterized membrane protein